MPKDYLPILVFMAVAFGLSLFMIFLSWLRSKRNAYADKDSPYECGFDSFDSPQENARHRTGVQFYLVAILFVIFDLEIAFLFPWALSLKSIGVFGFWSMMSFLFILGLGFAYEWRKGALDWE